MAKLKSDRGLQIMSTEIDAAGVARYLQAHPDFFERHDDLLTLLHIPGSHGDQAISISERQMPALREKARQLEGKLAQLIRFGEENDAISEKVHRLAVELLAAGDLPTVINSIYDHLGGAFAVPHVALRLWQAPGSGDSAEFAPLDSAARDFASGLTHPYCGPTAGQDATLWFGERGSHIRSLALVPLRCNGATFGALVLASEEAHRFYVEMGTLYLARIGELAANAILRTLA
jgi:uncharacterized protein YigA (DUF484 family)